MQKENTQPKLYSIPCFADHRGQFAKIYTSQKLPEFIKDFNIKEVYITTNFKRVIKGMHFQIPPYDYDKVVYPITGQILDVLIDIRNTSPNYAKVYTYHLSSKDPKAIFIPAGFAHGFKVLSSQASVLYLQNQIYSPQHDQGILYNSFSFDWQIKNPIISSRDLSFPKLSDFSSPFN